MKRFKGLFATLVMLALVMYCVTGALAYEWIPSKIQSGKQFYISTEAAAAIDNKPGDRYSENGNYIYYHGWVANSNPRNYTPIRWITLSDLNVAKYPNATVSQIESKRTDLPVYCIEEGGKFQSRKYIAHTPAQSAYFSKFNLGQRRGVEFCTIYGFPAMQYDTTKYTKGDAYAATQVMIWDFLSGERQLAFTYSNGTTVAEKNPAYTALAKLALTYPGQTKDKPAMDLYKKLRTMVYNGPKQPSFLEDPCTSDKPIVLKLDAKNQVYTATITDSTGILNDMVWSTRPEHSLRPTPDTKVSIFYNSTLKKMQCKIEIPAKSAKTIKTKHIVLTKEFPILTNHQPLMVLDNFQTNVNQRAIVGQHDQAVVNTWLYFRFEGTGTLNLKKTSPDGNISGIKFTIKNKNSSETYTVVTDKNGTFKMDLKPGTYVVTENPSANYIEQPAQTVTLAAGDNKTVTFNNAPKTGELKVIKTAEDNFVEGIVFRLKGTSATKQTVNMTAVTDANGVAWFQNVPITAAGATYTLTEENCPPQYETPVPVKVAIEWNKVTEQKFENVLRNKAGVYLIKFDEDYPENKLVGATFEVYADTNKNGSFDKEEDELVQKLKDVGEGVYESEEALTPGQYFVQETEAPLGYELDEGVYPFEITESQTKYTEIQNKPGVGFANAPQKGKLQITKRSEDGKLAGFTFLVKGETFDGDPYSQEFVTDENGEILIEGLRVGTYLVSEVDNEATANYLLPPDKTVIIERNTTSELEFYNKNLGGVYLTKFDKDYPEHKLSGAQFAVYADSNANGKLDETDPFVGYMIERSKGNYHLAPLATGDYFVKETVTPVGFDLDEGVYPFTIVDENSVEVENQAGKGFYNNAQHGSLRIIKTSEDGKLEGFAFSVSGTTFMGETYYNEFETDENGEIFIENLRVGTYVVSELRNETASKYYLPQEQTVVISKDTTAKVEFYNELIPEVPQTGDHANLLLWQIMLLVSGCALVVLIKRRHERA